MLRSWSGYSTLRGHAGKPWLGRRDQARDAGDHLLVKQASQIIDDTEQIIADLERALPKAGEL